MILIPLHVHYRNGLSDRVCPLNPSNSLMYSKIYQLNKAHLQSECTMLHTLALAVVFVYRGVWLRSVYTTIISTVHFY